MRELFVGADRRLWTSRTRSVRIDGMATSVRLEGLFWTTLEEIAARDALSTPQLLQRLHDEAIDEEYDLGNFTSFLRVCCLRFAELKAEGASGLHALKP